MLGKIESGVVTRAVGVRGAFAVEETITLPDGRSFPKSYTVWAAECPPIGAIVQVTGEVTIKQREYAAPSGMKTAIDVNFNNPAVVIMGAPVETVQAVENVETILGATQEVPF